MTTAEWEIVYKQLYLQNMWLKKNGVPLEVRKAAMERTRIKLRANLMG